MAPPTGVINAYLIDNSSPFFASIEVPRNTRMPAIVDVIKRMKNDSARFAKITEYTNIGNGMKSKNKTATKIPIDTELD